MSQRPVTDARPRRGFTLVELLVAMALMTILTGSVVFIFMQAQKIFVTVDAKVQLYQYARYAFDQMERDLANVVHTQDMEFYQDVQPPSGSPRKGAYDPGGFSTWQREDHMVRGTANLDGDPLGGDAQYNYGFTLRQPVPYEDRDDPSITHPWDSIYFKTVTSLNGQVATTLIEYALTDTDRERPRLIRRVWQETDIDSSNPNALKPVVNDGDGLPKEQDLCLYATEARFELFTRNLRWEVPGDYYSAERLVDPPNTRVDGMPAFPPHHNYWGSGYMVQAFYDPFHDSSVSQPDMGIFQADMNDSSSTPQARYFSTQRGFTFPNLNVGDTIYLANTNGTAGSDFEGAYTIKAFKHKASGGSSASITCDTDWDPNPPVGSPPDPSDFRIEFERGVIDLPVTALGQPRIHYAAGWLPGAVRVTLQIKDAKSLESRSVSRVFKILSE